MREFFKGTSRRLAGDKSLHDDDNAMETNTDDILLISTLKDEPAGKFLESDSGSRCQKFSVDRIDYAIQQNAFESMNEFLSAIHSHFAYWECEDCVQFIVDQLLKVLDTKHGDHSPS